MDKRSFSAFDKTEKLFYAAINLIKYVSKQDEFLLLYSPFRSIILNIYNYKNIQKLANEDLKKKIIY